MLAVYANDTDTVVTVTSSYDVTYDGSEGTLAWTPDSTTYGVFQDMYSWMRISCLDGSFLAVSSPFVISMTAAPTQVPSQVPSSVPSQVPLPAPSALPTPFPTTGIPTQMPTLYPTPAPSFSPTPYATTLIVPQQLIIEATKPHIASADIFLVNLERNDQQFSIEKHFDAIDQVHALGVRLGVDHGPADAFLLPPSGTTLKLSKQRVRVNVNTTGIPSGTYDLSLDITTSSSTVNDANGEEVVRSTVTNVPIKLTVIAVAYWNTTSTEIIDGPTLGQTWDGIRVTARDRDGYPIVNDVTGAGQSFGAQLEGGGDINMTQICSFVFDTVHLYYLGSCQMTDIGRVGNWKLSVWMTEDALDTVFFRTYVPSYCPPQTFARVSGKLINSITKVKLSNLPTQGWPNPTEKISNNEMAMCLHCNEFKGLRCGEFGMDRKPLCEPGQLLNRMQCSNIGETTNSDGQCLCPPGLEKQSQSGLTTLTIKLLPDYWRAYAWSEEIWPCAQGGGCKGDANSSDAISSCGISIAGDQSARVDFSNISTVVDGGVCSGGAIHMQLNPYKPEISGRGLVERFMLANPQLANCPDCFTYGPKVVDSPNPEPWGGGAYNDAYCKLGYTGPLCSVCYYMWYDLDGKCFRCGDIEGQESNFVMFGIFSGVAVCVGGVMGGLVLKRKKKEKREMRTKGSSFVKASRKHKDNMLKILFKENKLKVFMLVVTFQVLYQFHQVTTAAAKMTEEPDKSYPAPADRVVAYLQVFNFEFLRWIPPACIRPGASFYDTLLIKTLIPLALIGLMISIAFIKLMRPSTINDQRKRDKAIAGAVQGVSLLIELVLPSVSTTICQTFVCDLYDDFPLRGALRADNTLLCDWDAPDRSWWWFYGSFMGIVYPIAMPCVLIAIFYRNRKEIDKVLVVWKHHDDECKVRGESTAGWTIQDVKLHMAKPENGGHEISGTVMALAPNFMKFDPACWWMGTFLLVVRICQTSLLIFLSDPEVQATFGAFISLICVVTIREFEPYRIDSDDTVAILSQWLLFIFMAILLLIRVGTVEKIQPWMMGTALVIIIAGLFGVAIKSVYDDYKSMAMKVQTLEPDQDDDESKRADPPGPIPISAAVEMTVVNQDPNPPPPSAPPVVTPSGAVLLPQFAAQAIPAPTPVMMGPLVHTPITAMAPSPAPTQGAPGALPALPPSMPSMPSIAMAPPQPAAVQQVATVTGLDLAEAATLISRSGGDTRQAISRHFDGQDAAGQRGGGGAAPLPGAPMMVLQQPMLQQPMAAAPLSGAPIMVLQQPMVAAPMVLQQPLVTMTPQLQPSPAPAVAPEEEHK